MPIFHEQWWAIRYQVSVLTTSLTGDIKSTATRPSTQHPVCMTFTGCVWKRHIPDISSPVLATKDYLFTLKTIDTSQYWQLVLTECECFRHYLANFRLINIEIFLKYSLYFKMFYVFSYLYVHELNCNFTEWFSNIELICTISFMKHCKWDNNCCQHTVVSWVLVKPVAYVLHWRQVFPGWGAAAV